MSSNPPARIPTPDPPPGWEPPPDVVPTARYRRLPAIPVVTDEEPTEPGTPPPPPSEWAAMGVGLL